MTSAIGILISLVASYAALIFIIVLIPPTIAAIRQHPNGWPITVLSLFSPCSFGILWVVALAWSVCHIERESAKVHEVPPEEPISDAGQIRSAFAVAAKATGNDVVEWWHGKQRDTAIGYVLMVGLAVFVIVLMYCST